MEKKYIKPEMVISQVEMEDLLQTIVVSGNTEGEGAFDSKRRGGYSSFSEEEEEWVKETDMWGNECWTRTR